MNKRGRFIEGRQEVISKKKERKDRKVNMQNRTRNRKILTLHAGLFMSDTEDNANHVLFSLFWQGKLDIDLWEEKAGCILVKFLTMGFVSVLLIK